MHTITRRGDRSTCACNWTSEPWQRPDVAALHHLDATWRGRATVVPLAVVDRLALVLVRAVEAARDVAADELANVGHELTLVLTMKSAVAGGDATVVSEPLADAIASFSVHFGLVSTDDDLAMELDRLTANAFAVTERNLEDASP